MKNSELQAILKTLPDDTEVVIGTWCEPIHAVERSNTSINGKTYNYIKILDRESA